MARKRHHQAARERDLHTIRLLNDLLDTDQVMGKNHYECYNDQPSDML